MRICILYIMGYREKFVMPGQDNGWVYTHIVLWLLIWKGKKKYAQPDYNVKSNTPQRIHP